MRKFVTVIAEPNYSANAIAQYKKLGSVYFWFESSSVERARIAKRADILVVRLALQVTKRVIDSMPNLKIIATSTTGLNHIDVAYAEKRDIKIISLRGETSFLKNIPSTAEEGMALMMALVRNIPWAFDDVKKNKWDTNRWAGHQLLGKRIGTLGLGRLGKLLAGYARAFGMEVIAHDPYVSTTVMKRYGVKKVSESVLFKTSDIVFLNVLLTKETHNLVGERQLRMMQPTSYLINTARGELIKKGVLLKALKNKWISGAAIDVMWDEENNGGHLRKNPLTAYARKNKNLIIVPHIAGTTYDAMRVTQNFIADLVLKYCKK